MADANGIKNSGIESRIRDAWRLILLKTSWAARRSEKSRHPSTLSASQWPIVGKMSNAYLPAYRRQSNLECTRWLLNLNVRNAAHFIEVTNLEDHALGARHFGDERRVTNEHRRRCQREGDGRK